MATGDTKRNLDDVLEAIEGSGGVKAVVARRLGVTRKTLNGYLAKWVTAELALKQEEKSVGDIAKSIIVGNLRAAYNAQQEAAANKNWAAAVVDSGDAKWWLRMKLRDEFSERQELTGADGGPLLVVNWDDATDDTD